MQKLSVYSMPSWESTAALFEIHLRLKREMTDVSMMLKIKLHVLHIIWHSGHMLISEASPLDHSAVFWRNKFYDRCHQRCKELIALAQLPGHDTSHQLGFSSYVLTIYLILASPVCLTFGEGHFVCLPLTVDRRKDEKLQLRLPAVSIRYPCPWNKSGYHLWKVIYTEDMNGWTMWNCGIILA